MFIIEEPSKNYSYERDGITQSLFEMYMQCPRKFAIRTLGWDTTAKFAMQRGAFGHKAIENFRIDREHNRKSISKEKYCQEWFEKSFKKYKFQKGLTKNQEECIRGAFAAIMPAYVITYFDSDGKYKFSPEYIFDIVVEGVRIRGKIDSFVQSITNSQDAGLLETKFKSRISENDLDISLALDWQSLVYLWAMVKNTIGEDPLFVDYDVVRFPSVKDDQKPFELYKSISESIKKEPEHWFKRWRTNFSRQDIDVFRKGMWLKLKEFRQRFEQKGSWYRNECNCQTRYGVCPYMKLCSTGNATGLIRQPLFTELNEE